MARGKGKGRKPSKRPIEQYDHKGKKRLNNPPVGLVTPQTDPLGATHKTYEYEKPVPSVRSGKEVDYDPHVDPQLVWAGKKEHTSFKVPTVSLHVHERIDSRTIIEAVRKRNGQPVQPSLFERPEEKLPLRDAIDFYKHAHGWSNRLIAGDSLLVMNSLLEKEGMPGQVQTVYIDPPYGIKYGSNFQPFVNKRDVKDGKDEDLTQEPEMIRAFRDTWELGIHSYLTYLRDRLLLAHELLHESGSCFVQISDENLHHVRELMDDVFGHRNFVSVIHYTTAGGFTSATRSRAGDFLLWYAKSMEAIKYRRLFQTKKSPIGETDSKYDQVELPDRTRRALTVEEKLGSEQLPDKARIFPSVWIEQEIAMATLMEQVLGRRLHVALFIQHGMAIEGIRQQIQLNPIEFANNDEVIAQLGEILPTWSRPLYVSDEERQKMADSVILSIKTDNGHHRYHTIQVENHSKHDMDIKCISLWSKNQTAKFSDNQRVSKPAFRPENANWCVPAQRTIPIQFDAQEDVAQRLWQLAGTPPDYDPRSGGRLFGSSRQFQIEVRVALRCEVLGLEREFEETRTVQVDFINRQITGV